MKRVKHKSGFTLVEIIVTIAVIGILATITVVVLTKSRQKSEDARRVNDARVLQDAIELYIEDNGEPPLAGLYFPQFSWQAFVNAIDQYIPGEVPVGTWDNPYAYCLDNNDADTPFRDYLVGALLDVEHEIESDIDGPQRGYMCDECVYDTPGACGGLPNCNDDDTGYIRNSPGPTFCVGHARPEADSL